METLLASLLEKNPAFGWLVGTTVVIGLVIKILKGLLDFHYDYFTRRLLRRMADLLPLVEPTSQHHSFLKQMIAAEVFRIASGVDENRRKAEALMQLCLRGVISPKRLKHVAQYLELSAGGRLEVQIGFADKIIIGYSAIASITILCYGFFSFASLAWTSQPTGWIAGSIIFMMCAAGTAYLSSDFKKYRATKRLEPELAPTDIEAPPQPEEATQTTCSPEPISDHSAELPA